jgi:hypothetical protein
MWSPYLLVDVEFAEDFGGVEEVGVVDDPVVLVSAQTLRDANRFLVYALLDIPCNQGQVEDQGQPVSVDKEQEGQEPMDGNFRDDVRVEAVAEVDRVDVVAVKNNTLAFSSRQ